MEQRKKIVKKIGLILLVALVVMQFFQPTKNNSGITTKSIEQKYPMSAEVKDIMKTACLDCHSNTTIYPWYTKIQPLGWWINHHVNEGKEHLNFDEFLNYKIARQYHKLEEIGEVLEEGEMPLSSYTIIHKEAKLSKEQSALLISWANAARDSMKKNYPADSLVRPKKR